MINEKIFLKTMIETIKKSESCYRVKQRIAYIENKREVYNLYIPIMNDLRRYKEIFKKRLFKINL